MPIYCYKCSTHGTFDHFGNITAKNDISECPVCNNVCKRDYETEFKSKDSIDCMDRKERWSRSMGVHPNQIEAAKKLFPGSVYHPKTGDLLISGRADKLRKMKQRNMHEIEFN